MDFAASTDAEPALDAGIKVHRHRNVTVIKQWDVFFFLRWKTARRNVLLRGHIPKVRRFIVRNLLLWLISDKHFHHHATRLNFARLVSCYDHAVGWFTDTRCGQSAFTINRDHTRPAVSVGPIALLRLVAEVRNDKATAIGNFPNRFTGHCGDCLTVEGKCDRGHGRAPCCQSNLHHFHAH
uniref:Uncharacterized protein n=1 Tax=uncultured marine bacterium Ant24C4 TaxID=360425 RepID=Q2PYD6_9BACT|nr:hypothetical protein [uncultured marine bacterium Ant24C4]